MNKLLQELYVNLSYLHIDDIDNEHHNEAWKHVFECLGGIFERSRTMAYTMGLDTESLELERLSRVTPRGGLCTKK